MEIKIIISDTGSGGSGAPSMQVGVEAPSPGINVDSSAASGQQMSAPPEILRAAAAIGAIDGGPAPGVGATAQFGVPPPFSSMGGPSDLGGVMTSQGTSAGQSAAAAPSSGSVFETLTAPGEDVSE